MLHTFMYRLVGCGPWVAGAVLSLRAVDQVFERFNPRGDDSKVATGPGSPSAPVNPRDLLLTTCKACDSSLPQKHAGCHKAPHVHAAPSSGNGHEEPGDRMEQDMKAKVTTRMYVGGICCPAEEPLISSVLQSMPGASYHIRQNNRKGKSAYPQALPACCLRLQVLCFRQRVSVSSTHLCWTVSSNKSHCFSCCDCFPGVVSVQVQVMTKVSAPRHLTKMYKA